MKLLTKELERKLPPLYHTEAIPTKEIKFITKYFTPDSDFTWYVAEYDPTTKDMYGYTKTSRYQEWGYFSLIELMAVKGPLGLKVERDLYFTPCTVDKIS